MSDEPAPTLTDGARLHGRALGDEGVAAHFSGRAQLQGMLDVEAALAGAEAAVGVVPASCVEPIRAAARAELYDCARIADEATETGNPVIPVVRRLTERVAAADADAARFVHWGATSQDVLDTGLVLQLRAAAPAVIDHLARGARAAAGHARRYAGATMAGRTWLQQATPVTFGLKAAGWADALDRAWRRLAAALDEALVLQFGGAAGTLAALGSQGLAVTGALAARLGLPAPDLPWHAHRDRFAQLACALGVAAGAAGKIGRDVALLAQTEVGEVAERAAPGRGGSSTMPQKRNPVAAATALAAAGRAPGLVATMLGALVQEHERGLGGWQVEWDRCPIWWWSPRAGRGRRPTRWTVWPSTRIACAPTRTPPAASCWPSRSPWPWPRRSASTKRTPASRRPAGARRTNDAPLAEVLGEDPRVTRHLDRDAVARRLAADGYLGATRDYIDRVVERVGDSRS